MKPYINTIQHRMLTYISLLLCIIMMHSCSDIIDTIGGDDTISEGEEVRFTTLVPEHTTSTRSAKDEWQEGVKAYKPVNRDYELTVSMYREGNASPHSSSTFIPLVTDGTTPANYDGTLQLKEGATPLYWQDNVNKWGFVAEANSNTLSADQDSQQKWLAMDHIKGYSYLPIWKGGDDDGNETDNVDAINCRTTKEWYADNKLAQQLSGIMVDEGNSEAYKKIPLYMKHQRAWITVILKADDGVTREQLYYKGGKNNIAATISSYDEKNGALAVTAPWEQGETIDYPNDKNGEACTDSTTRYDAIVMPHHYNAEEKIAEISLSGQRFTFSPANDYCYEKSLIPGADGHEKAVEAMKVYDLKAGQHLTITATLSRKSRMVLITAWVEDWTEVATSTVCDDYGQEGDPIIINTKQELIDFLASEKTNKAGMVGIISPKTMNLDLDGEWVTQYDLNATLNIAGATLSTSSRLFNTISSSGTITNGNIELKNGKTVDAVVAQTNSGTIERLNIRTEKTATEGEQEGKATLAGVVDINHGTIYRCNSDIEVRHTGAATEGTVYIGGIAAKNIYNENMKSVMPVIDYCTVTAKVSDVSGSNNVKGGGITGQAAGRVTNNTFTYGISISQNPDNFKNIFSETADDANAVRAYNNAWPTKALNSINNDTETNINTWDGKFDAVIDSQPELEMLLLAQYNKKDNRYRIADSFTVNSATWKHGKQDDSRELTGDDCNGNMVFSLDGNNSTITLTGTEGATNSTVSYWSEVPGKGTQTTVTTAPMLFTNIMGEVKDLVLYLDKPVVAQPSIAENQTSYSGSDAIAPLGYAVAGKDARVSNIRVKGAAGTYVQSATPASIVVWAYDEATVEDCKSDTQVQMWLPYNSTGKKDARNYAGGIVACAGKATITRCQYNGILQPANTSADIEKCYYGGIVGGTSLKNVNSTSYIPELEISDCSSWWNAGTEKDGRKGGIIGFTAYISGSAASDIHHGMAKGNEGNWWTAESNGTGYHVVTVTEKDAIGVKNSVTPTWTAD